MDEILLVPGLHNSGPDHWQSRWHTHFPHWQRVTGQTWERADLPTWSGRVAEWLQASSGKVHLVAHSFGTLAAIAAARHHADRIASLFIVAPADPANFAIADRELAAPLPFAARLIASRNDPWMSLARAHYWSQQWQVSLIDVGEAGHINAQSGHGEWPEGLQLLAELLQESRFPQRQQDQSVALSTT